MDLNKMLDPQSRVSALQNISQKPSMAELWLRLTAKETTSVHKIGVQRSGDIPFTHQSVIGSRVCLPHSSALLIVVQHYLGWGHHRHVNIINIADSP